MSGELSLKEIHERAAQLRALMIKARIEALTEVYGSVRMVGYALNIDHAYLQRLAKGEKQNPSDAVLRKLGLL